MHFLRTIILFLSLLPGAAFAAELGAARLSLIKGDVQVYTNDTQDWVAASINMPLMEGDRLWVPEGARAEVHIQGGVYIRLGSASAFDILTLQEESYQFYLNGGHAYINNRQGGIDHIQVDTPLTSIGCYDNSLVMVDVAEGGDTEVSVLKGYAYAETRSGMTSVGSGEAIHIGGDMTAETFPLPPPDEWETWNRERDAKLAAGNRSLRYLPAELDDYAEDLDNNGQWVYVTDYGYCWRPLTVAVGWSPYRQGRWCWVGGDYVWVSYDPWGWCPHHYGRWTFVVNFGWCWVPPRPGAVYWGPGFVGWISSPTHVAWVPLAPGEVFYGHRYYGPGSVNITNVTVNQTVVYRNVNVRNAVTVVTPTTFVSGRKEPVKFKGNPFREANGKVGPPTFKPTRETARPVIRNVPQGKKPPERVQRLSVSEIKRERPLVREEKGSVFRPGRPGKEMPVQKRSEPQSVIRQQHPPVPEQKPGKRSPFAPRGAQTPAVQQSEPARGRQGAQPVEQPPKGERQPPAKQPEIIRGRPIPPAAVPPQAEQPPAAAPGKPVTQPRGASPGKPQKEPRWQEPLPAGKPGMPQQHTSPQSRPSDAPAGKPAEQKQHTSPQSPPRQPAPAGGAPVQQNAPRTAPQTRTMPSLPATEGGSRQTAPRTTIP